MTEKDIIRIAEATSKIIIDHIESKQAEWNNEFEKNIEQAGYNFSVDHTSGTYQSEHYKMPDEQERLDIQIYDLKTKLTEAIEAEKYTLASKINSEIINLKAKQK